MIDSNNVRMDAADDAPPPPVDETIVESYRSFRLGMASHEVSALLVNADMVRKQTVQLRRVADLMEKTLERLSDPLFLVGFFRQCERIYENLERSREDARLQGLSASPLEEKIEAAFDRINARKGGN